MSHVSVAVPVFNGITSPALHERLALDAGAPVPHAPLRRRGMLTLAAQLQTGRGITAPARAALFAAVYALAWGAGLAFSRGTPALDSAEQMVWSYALEWGYWKHPPLPSWIMHGLVSLFGPSTALPTLTVQACVGIALLLVWRLACEFMPPDRALAAAALTSLVNYHGFGADAFNHNTVLLPFQAAVLLCFVLAMQHGRWRDWLLCGLFAGLALLVKYMALLALAPLLLYFALEPRARTRRQFVGLALAGATALLVFTPHLLWLHSHDWLPLQYARAVTTRLYSPLDRAGDLAGFLVGQLLPLLPLLLAIAWLQRRSRGAARESTAVQPGSRRFLWIAGAGPFMLLVLYAALTGTQMLPRWGATVFLLAGCLALDLMRRQPASDLSPTQWTVPPTPAVLRTVFVLQLLMWVAVVLIAPRVVETLNRPSRSLFPGAQIAALAQSTWQEEVRQPLRLVVTDTWLGGNMAAHHGKPLAVLLHGEYTHSPWVASADIERCGALVLLLTDGREVPGPGAVRLLERSIVRGAWTIPWSDKPQSRVSHITWGILQPAPGAHCRL